jgi:putative sterol carrier protein
VAESVKEFFDGLPSQFKADKAAGLSAVFQFDIQGDGGGQWHADIDDGACSVVEGAADAPNITITAGDEDWLSIVNGRLNPQMAFMTGKVKVKGDVGLAMRLQSIFF